MFVPSPFPASPGVVGSGPQIGPWCAPFLTAEAGDPSGPRAPQAQLHPPLLHPGPLHHPSCRVVTHQHPPHTLATHSLTRHTSPIWPPARFSHHPVSNSHPMHLSGLTHNEPPPPTTTQDTPPLLVTSFLFLYLILTYSNLTTRVFAPPAVCSNLTWAN